MDGDGKGFSIAVLSGKGGVGKTTICLNLARQISLRGPVWLIDIDLFNRGTTSAIWESEKEIPLSVAELIKASMPPRTEPGKNNLAARLGIIEGLLQSHAHELAYTQNLKIIPAARAREGREASYILWHGLKQEGLAAEDFLQDLLSAIGSCTPGCVVIFDGHGGLDELSIGAALVSSITYIINEPDLITFTGSITLYDEIAKTYAGKKTEPRIEFIINRVAPGKTVDQMETEFGDVLRTISPAEEPVTAYFPLERELFSAFGEDPFVSEIYTEYWFSKKIDLIARHVIQVGATLGLLKASESDKNDKQQLKKDAITRAALRREFYKRGDLLALAWLVLFVVSLGTLLIRAVSTFRNELGASGFAPNDLLVLYSGAGIWLLIQSRRWLIVQRIHLRNARSIRRLHGRRRRLGDSESAHLREQVELREERSKLWSGLSIAAALVGVFGLIFALLVPNFLDALQEAKQKRSVADIRNTGTAMFAWLTDQVGAAAAGQQEVPKELLEVDMASYEKITLDALSKTLVPQYIQLVQKNDGWNYDYDYRLNVKKILEHQVMSIRSTGRDGRFEGNRYQTGHFDPTDYDRDLVWADGFFIRWPQR